MSNKQRNYEAGYKAGYNGKAYNPDLSKYIGYDEGFDHGRCDMPTLDEIMPIDMGKEASTACLV